LAGVRARHRAPILAPCTGNLDVPTQGAASIARAPQRPRRLVGGMLVC
jgi:hypothetical protein